MRNSHEAIVKLVVIESNLYAYCFCLHGIFTGESHQFERNVINAFYNKF